MRPLRLALDVGVGQAGERILRDSGHHVVVVANHAESDRAWFARALAAGVEVVISPDADVEILAYDHNVIFHKPRQGVKSERIAYDFLRLQRKYITMVIQKEERSKKSA